MIQNHDRSGWFGASDTDKIIGNWKTATWQKWWLQKMGINRDHFDNRFTLAGTNWEHRILDHLNIPGMEKDKQVLLEELLLRVNLDGNTEDCIYEVKTFQWAKGFKLPQKYINQVRVQMYATGMRKAKIVAYGLEESDYDNYLRPLDPSRLLIFDIEYDQKWIDTKFLPKLRILAHNLRRGAMPIEAAI